jgi:inner membrane protein
MSSKMPPAPLPGIRRSAGLKLILICALVLLMSIPAMFIGAISYERSSEANKVVDDVSRRYGGPQVIIGPILSIPYESQQSDGATETGHYIIYADSGLADFTSVEVETKTQALYKVPIYTAKGELTARFEAPLLRLETQGLELDMKQAKVLVSVSDVRGLKQDVALRSESGVSQAFEPWQRETNVRTGASATYEFDSSGNRKIVRPAVPGRSHTALPSLGHWMAVPAATLLTSGDSFEVTVDLVLSGAQNLSVLPFAKSTDVRMSSNWADPGFQGEFTPSQRSVTETGFTANWAMPYLSRGIRGQGKSSDVLRGIDQNAVRVKFVNTDNPYQTVNRALKYSVLFIGLVFLAYFLFEVIVGTPVHPAQYILIGLAQAIFYLLLLAFAERVGFTLAFMIASSLTVAVTSAYAGAVFGGRSYIWKAGGVFATVYGLLFVLMRIADFALMIGALASFVAIAATMYLTRDMDWYGGTKFST